MGMNKYLVESRIHLNTMDLLFRVKVTIVELEPVRESLNKSCICPYTWCPLF